MTISQWKTCVAEGGCRSNPRPYRDYLKYAYLDDKNVHPGVPVDSVSYFDAMDYIH